MATTVLEIQVFAMFLLDPNNLEHSNWNWTHCLTFPLDTLRSHQFTPKPYKWIRYATGVVVGAQGDLSFSPDSPHDVVEYDHDLPSESANLYYHTSDAEKQRMFPADPDMGRTTITSSDPTTRVDLRSQVIERDGTCVLTRFHSPFCDAAHLLPHSKGDEYIDTYTHRRSRDPDGNDIVSEIDDVRNGILLNAIAHRTLGKDIAFLMTPNFAMSTADVDPTAQPTEKRCIAHLFDPDLPESFGDTAFHSGSQVRMPNTADKWPPNILFDAVYANAVLRHFAPQTMQDILKRWKPAFYPRGITSAAQASHKVIIDERATTTERRDEQNQAREQRAARRANRTSRADDDCIDYFDCLMMLPYILVPPEKQEEVWRKALEKSAEREQSRVEDKVVGWAREVANACS
ncbi:hypothetical protein V8E55_003301 [Tylopilus felleus]